MAWVCRQQGMFQPFLHFTGRLFSLDVFNIYVPEHSYVTSRSVFQRLVAIRIPLDLSLDYLATATATLLENSGQ
jgi:hypothetical protein